LVKFAAEKVKFLKSEILKSGFAVLVRRIPKRAKKTKEMARKLIRYI